MFVSAIVVAAGKGKRLGSQASKPVLKLNSRPIISFSLDVLNKHPWIKEIIVVANPGNIRALGAIIRRDKPRKEVKLVLGGKERKDSVAQGLKALNPRAELVLIHDAARPFITSGLVASVIKEARRSKAAILGVAVKPTIKRCGARGAGRRVKETIDRRDIWEIQTPQVFQKDLILDAYKKYGRRKVTDDAMLVEKLGKPVSIVPGSSLNIKITTPEDLIIAKGIAGWKHA